ncbi:hypothetical protein SAMN05428975_3311 [Mucilaginibacter sp. OK268]|nr:hypothetical protein SAMN05428975_3311 [Mucilaginibacter sp. OK268]
MQNNAVGVGTTGINASISRQRIRIKYMGLFSWQRPTKQTRYQHVPAHEILYKRGPLKTGWPVAAAKRKFVSSSMCIMITYFMIAIHFRIVGVIGEQFWVSSFSLIRLRNYRSFFLHDESS